MLSASRASSILAYLLRVCRTLISFASRFAVHLVILRGDSCAVILGVHVGSCVMLSGRLAVVFVLRTHKHPSGLVGIAEFSRLAFEVMAPIAVVWTEMRFIRRTGDALQERLASLRSFERGRQSPDTTGVDVPQHRKQKHVRPQVMHYLVSLALRAVSIDRHELFSSLTKAL